MKDIVDEIRLLALSKDESMSLFEVSFFLNKKIDCKKLFKDYSFF